MALLRRDTSAFLLVDLQERLLPVIHENERLVENVAGLVRGMLVLGVPVLWAEQNPAGLGPTAPRVAQLMPGEPITKTAFSCCGEPRMLEAIQASGRRQVLLAGIEAHVCVHQTAYDLQARGFEVHVAADAVSSRTPENRAIGLERARAAGATITSVECALFELLERAEGPEFREILRIVK